MEDDRDALLNHQRALLAEQQETILQQRQELAERRYRDHLVDESPFGFALWLLLHDIQPFKWWYHRFD
jgi:hypothetical protein